jgi:hypothetical protein
VAAIAYQKAKRHRLKMRPFLNKNPGSDFRRARAKYFNFDWWRQSRDQNTYFPVAAKPNHPRYYVTSGREPLGTVFESRGVFSAIGVDGRLVGSSTSLKIAVDSLCPGASSS